MPFTRAAASIAVFVGIALVLPSVPAFADPIVWNGPSITFTKPDFADWTLPENQDRLTNDVWLTRRNTRPLFNIVVESREREHTVRHRVGIGPTNPAIPVQLRQAIRQLEFQGSQGRWVTPSAATPSVRPRSLH